ANPRATIAGTRLMLVHQFARALPIVSQRLPVAGQQGVGPRGLRDTGADVAHAGVGQRDVHAAAVPALGAPVVAVLGPGPVLKHQGVGDLIPVQSEVVVEPRVQGDTADAVAVGVALAEQYGVRQPVADLREAHRRGVDAAGAIT